MDVIREDVANPSGVPRRLQRRRRDSSRIRVTRACDRCKKRKVRCSGVQPCQLCVDAHLRCTFNASYNRGRRPKSPSIYAQEDGSPVYPRATLDGPTATVDQNSGPSLGGPEPPSRLLPNVPHDSNLGSAVAGGNIDSAPQSGQTEPELHGDYVGPASGVSFLLRAQKRLQQSSFSSDASSIFTFGDTPLRCTEPTYCVVMSKEEASILLQRYFDFAVPVDRFLHRPTVERWLQDFYETMGVIGTRSDAPTRRALLFMVFALAEEHMSPKPTAVTADLSVRYFLAAEGLLSKERGAVRLASVQARLCQCLWLLGQSRINHCWSLLGTTARLAVAIALHRKADTTDTNGINCIDLECRRRTFWSIYSLDRYLSTALGRPKIFHDDDIDQELPSCCNDEDIHPECIKPATGPKQSLMRAPVAYFKLGRILTMILRDLYSIRPFSFVDQCTFIITYSQNLKTWRAELSDFLDTSTSLLIPIFLRQRNVLNLAYWHTTILVHRQLFLNNATGSHKNGEDGHEVLHTSQINESVQECLDSAMNIANTVDEMIETEQMFQAFWFTPYFAFSAVVILYVHTIRQSSLSLPVNYRPYFRAATRCQDQIHSIAEKASLSARYCMVLEELRIEAMRQLQRAPSPPPTAQDNWAANEATDDRGSLMVPSWRPISSNLLSPPGVPSDEDFVGFDQNPGDSPEDMMGTFNSILASGFGDLEGLLSNDFLRPW